jgi:CheY-like chemotaxis protein
MFDSQSSGTLLRYVTGKTSPASKIETMSETTLETILLVEDEPAVRQLFAQALKRAGYSVYEARNGQEAVKVFDQHGESIDMLLTDMRMPYMGGAELAHHLAAAAAPSSCSASPAIPATSMRSSQSISSRSPSRATTF